MVALSLHLLALTAAYYPVPVVQPPEQYQYYAYEPAPQFLARAGDVQMNTQYQPGVFAAIGRKKDPRTGQTKNLKGYTVGSRAPPMSRSSGTKAQYGYGISNLYGGQKVVAATSERPEGTWGFVGGGSGGNPELGLPLLLVGVLALAYKAFA